MNPKLEETVVLDFTTHNPSTGAVADADSTPTVEVFEDANDTPILTPTPTKRTAKTGNYRVSVACTAANGFEAGKSYNVVVTATVATVTGKAPIKSLLMRTRGVDDVLPTSSYTAPPTAAAIRSEIDANSTKLDTNVGSRLATAGYTSPPAASAIRSEIDANSTKLDVAVGTRLAAAGYTAPPTVAAIRAEMDANSTKLDATVGSRLAAASYVAPANSDISAIKAKTDNLPADPASNTQVNTRLAAASYTAPDNAGIASIAADLATKLDVVLSTRLAAGDYTSPLAVLTQTVKKYNVVEVLRLLEAALAGKVTGATSGTPGTTVIRDANDTKNVISSVGDGVGNRSAVTVDPT